MFGWLKKLIHKRSVGRLVTRLGAALASKHGKRSWFTPGQVRKAFAEKRFSGKLLPVAYAVFLHQDDFDVVSDEDGIDLAYTSQRMEVVELLYGTDALVHLAYYDGRAPADSASVHEEGKERKNWFVDRPRFIPHDMGPCYGGYHAPTDPSA
jgi:hypothetical protein